MTSLFRPEVTLNGIRTNYKPLAFQRTVGWPSIALCASGGALALVLVGVLALQRTTIEAAGMVELGRGAVQISSPGPARILRIDVAVNAKVKEGQTLAIVTSTQGVGNDAAAADVELAAIGSRRAAVDAQNLEDATRLIGQRGELLSQIAVEEQAIASLQARLPSTRAVAQSARESLDDYRALAAKGFIRRADLRARDREVLMLDGELANAQLDMRTRQTRIESMRSQIALLERTKGAVSQRVRSEKARLRADQHTAEAKRAYPLVSPVDGRIRSSFGQVGAVLAPGQAIMLVDRRVNGYNVVVDIPAEESASIKVGAAVFIRHVRTSTSQMGSYRGHIGEIQGLNATVPGARPTYRFVVTGVRPLDRAASLPPVGTMVRVTIALPDDALHLAGLRQLLEFSGLWSDG